MEISLLDISRRPVVSAKGRRIGKVADVLVHPDENRVAGFVVQRPRILLMLDRKDGYLALDRVTVAEDVLVASSARDAWDGRAGRRLGIDWDESVIWHGMPVVTRGGTSMGTVRDLLFDTDSGAIKAMGLSGGLAADAALGVRDVPARLLVGFDGKAVVVSNEAASFEVSGGAAEVAGKQAAILREQASESMKAAEAAGKKAVQYGKAAAKAAARSDTGKKVGGWLKSLRDEVVDAMGDPDDD